RGVDVRRVERGVRRGVSRREQEEIRGGLGAVAEREGDEVPEPAWRTAARHDGEPREDGASGRDSAERRHAPPDRLVLVAIRGERSLAWSRRREAAAARGCEEHW